MTDSFDIAVALKGPTVYAPSPPPEDPVLIASRLVPAYRDPYYGGTGRIRGTVTVDAEPARRKVRLFDLRTGALLREQWSGADGSYSFDWIDRNRAYTVMAHDHEHKFNAVVADAVTPEAMS